MSKNKWGPMVRRPYSNPGDVHRIAALAALVDSLRCTASPKAKKDILFETIQREPYLEKLIRIAYDPKIKIHFNSTDVETAQFEAGPFSNLKCILAESIKRQVGPRLAAGRYRAFVSRLEEPLRSTALALIDKKLGCGLKIKWVNEVFRKLGLREIPEKTHRGSTR